MFRIAIEGIDGSGKTSLAKLIHKEALEVGLNPHTIHQFKNSKFDLIAAAFNDTESMTPEVLAALHAGCRIEDESKIPNDTSLLVLDRSIYSTYASCILRGAKEDLLTQLVKTEKEPNLIVFLNSDPRLCYERVIERGKIKFYESGLDRLYRGRISEGRELFHKEHVSHRLIKEVFVDSMFTWNNLLKEVIPRDSVIETVDFDLKDGGSLVKEIMSRVKCER
jgi:dTMP kinase